MESWELKADGGLILQTILCHPCRYRSHYTKPIIPTFQNSIIPLPLAAEFTAGPFVSDPQRRNRRLAQKTSSSATKY